MTYARNWTRNKGTSTSNGELRFAPPQRRTKAPQRQRIEKYVKRALRVGMAVAGPQRYRFAAKLALKTAEYYYDNQPKTLRDLADELVRDYGQDYTRGWVETQPEADIPGYYDAPGWTVLCTNSYTFPPNIPTAGGAAFFTFRNTTPSCIAGQAMTIRPMGYPVPANTKTIYTGTNVTSIQRLAIEKHMVAPANGSAPLPTWKPPRTQPAIRVAVPAPLRVITQPMRVSPSGSQRPGRIRLRGYQIPALEFSPQMSGGRGGSRVVAHNLVPPRKGDSEAKFKINLGLAGKLYGGFTEFQDFTESIAKAVKLDNGRDCRSRNPYNAWACIIANRDKLDRNAAAYNIIENQIEDFLIGQFGRAGAKAVAKAAAAGYYRSPVGLQFGGSYHRQTLSIGEIQEMK